MLAVGPSHPSSFSGLEDLPSHCSPQGPPHLRTEGQLHPRPCVLGEQELLVLQEFQVPVFDSPGER